MEAGLAAVLVVWVWLDTSRYPPPMAEGVPGSGSFPRLVAALLAGCAGWLALRDRGRRAAPPPRTAENHRLWMGAAWIAAFLLALPVVGSLVALALLAGGLMALAGERSPWILLAIPLAFAGGVQLLFAGALGVPLP